MHCKQFASGLFDPLHQFEGFLFCFQDSDLAEYGDLDALTQGLDHALNDLGLLQQEGAIVSFTGDSLRTT